MKVRVVEYRRDLRQKGIGPNCEPASSEKPSCHEPLERHDPGITDGWESLDTVTESVKVRSRMFYGVDSISEQDPNEYAHEDDLPGRTYKLAFETGEIIPVYCAVIAESKSESTPSINQHSA